AMPGTGFKSEALIQLKIVVFAPMPRASVRTVIRACPVALTIIRNAYRTSCQKDAMFTSPALLIRTVLSTVFNEMAAEQVPEKEGVMLRITPAPSAGSSKSFVLTKYIACG